MSRSASLCFCLSVSSLSLYYLSVCLSFSLSLDALPLHENMLRYLPDMLLLAILIDTRACVRACVCVCEADKKKQQCLKKSDL